MKNKIKIITLVVIFIALFNPFTLKFVSDKLNKNINSNILGFDDEFNDVTSTGEEVDENDLNNLKDSTVECA